MKIGNFTHLVATELAHARRLHPTPMHSLHEGYAVIKEELEEFWGEVKLKRSQRSKRRMLAEITQVAAMCQRIAEDLHIMDHGDGEVAP